MDETTKELLRDAWTLISAHQKGLRFDAVKANDWRDRFRARLNHETDSFGDLPNADDLP